METLNKRINQAAKNARMSSRRLLKLLDYALTPDNIRRLIGQRENELTASLHLVSSLNDIILIRSLLRKGAKVNSVSEYGKTALASAAQNGHTEACRFLIDKGADVNLKESGNWIPLMLTAQYNHAETCRFLIKKGADLNAKNSEGWTALMWAVANGHTGICRILIESGADKYATDKEGNKAIYFAKDHEIKKMLR
jgi:ankyrin repeat protein